MRLIARWVACCVFASVAMAQVDVVTQARELARSGQHDEALRLLERRLADQPRDTDARVLYGTILSWQRQFDRARVELQTVLREQPQNLDATLALVRVELWSGRRAEAERLATESLTKWPGNAELLELQRHARTRENANEVEAGVNYDGYSQSDDWREAFVTLKIVTRIGDFVGRASQAERFNSEDNQFEVEAYPRFGEKTYAYLAVGFSPDGILYPDTRFGAELFHTFPHAIEVSAGARRLNFEEAVDIYTGSIGKYAGNWLIGARLYDAEDETALSAIVRRYFGENRQFIGLRVGQGAREDIRSSTDVASLNTREIAVEGRVAFSPRWLINARAGFGEQEETEEERVSASVSVSWLF